MWRNLEVGSLVGVGKETTIRDVVDGLPNGRVPEDILDHGDTGVECGRGELMLSFHSRCLYTCQKNFALKMIQPLKVDYSSNSKLVGEQKFGNSTLTFVIVFGIFRVGLNCIRPSYQNILDSVAKKAAQ